MKSQSNLVQFWPLIPPKSTITRVATTQGKQGIWISTFLDRENCGNTGKILKI